MSAVLILVSEICWEIVCLKEKASQNILLSFTAPFCHLSFHFFFSLMLWWSLGRFYVWCHHVLKRLFVLDLMCRNMLKRNTVFINGSDKPFLWVKRKSSVNTLHTQNSKWAHAFQRDISYCSEQGCATQTWKGAHIHHLRHAGAFHFAPFYFGWFSGSCRESGDCP